MKLTRIHRAQIVELLRCAADNVIAAPGQFSPLYRAELLLETSVKIGNLARDAYYATEIGDLSISDWHTRFLEAARRVEEGSWSP